MGNSSEHGSRRQSASSAVEGKGRSTARDLRMIPEHLAAKGSELSALALQREAHAPRSVSCRGAGAERQLQAELGKERAPSAQFPPSTEGRSSTLKRGSHGSVGQTL